MIINVTNAEAIDDDTGTEIRWYVVVDSDEKYPLLELI